MPIPPPYPINTDLGAIVTLSGATAGGTSADRGGGPWRGVGVNINLSSVSVGAVTTGTGTATGTALGTASFLATIQGRDAGAATYYPLLVSPTLTATGFKALSLYPGISVIANTQSSLHLPATWNVVYGISGQNATITGTLSAIMLV